MERTLRLATIVDETEAEGPGRRWAIWLQGCSIRCPGCCNPEMFDARGGTAFTVAALVARSAAANVEGITILGGEPFEQAAAAADLAEAVRARGQTVMVFSGMELGGLRAAADPEVARFLGAIDLLVDAPFDRDRPEPAPPRGRRWIGSTNQTMHFLSAAYAEGDARLRAANGIEIHVSATTGAVTINGWPSADQLVPVAGRAWVRRTR